MECANVGVMGEQPSVDGGLTLLRAAVWCISQYRGLLRILHAHIPSSDRQGAHENGLKGEWYIWKQFTETVSIHNSIYVVQNGESSPLSSLSYLLFQIYILLLIYSELCRGCILGTNPLPWLIPTQTDKVQ